LDGKQNNLGFTPYNATNPSGFTANSTDAQLRDRTTHTGVQAIATVTGLQSALDSKQATGDYATNTTVTNGLNTKINNSEKAVANGVATLGSDGKVPNNQIPALAISETFEVTTQAAMLALTGVDQGDVAVRSDVSKAFILRQLPSTTLANWVELLTPASTVTSVAGKVGAVVLNSGDVGLGNVPNTNFTSAVNLNTAKITNATHTGDATGSTALTLATVNANIGSFGNSTTVPTVTVNGKGLVTAISATTIPTATTSVTGLLTSTDFNAFNAKISGTGTTNFLPKFTASGAVGNSGISENAIQILSDKSYVASNNNLQGFYQSRTSNVPSEGTLGGNSFTLRNGSTSEDLNFDLFNRITSVWYTPVIIKNTGNVGINTTNPTERLDVVGNGKFSGTVTATSFFQSSDIRLKNIIKRDRDVIYFTWKDKRDDKTHIGYIAQRVRATNPDQVNKDDKGYLSVNYIEILVEKIRNLEKEIELLKVK
jgi:hypothetical protein